MGQLGSGVCARLRLRARHQPRAPRCRNGRRTGSIAGLRSCHASFEAARDRLGTDGPRPSRGCRIVAFAARWHLDGRHIGCSRCRPRTVECSRTAVPEGPRDGGRRAPRETCARPLPHRRPEVRDCAGAGGWSSRMRKRG